METEKAIEWLEIIKEGFQYKDIECAIKENGYEKCEQAIETVLKELKDLKEYKKVTELTKISCCTAQNCEALSNSIKDSLENSKLKEELEKKDKMIELMVEKYNDDFGDIGDFCQHEYCSKDYNCKECIKQYFEKKAEEAE